MLWTGSPAAVDADSAAGDTGSLAAVVAAAAISAWLGAPVIRTRHVAPVRRAIDMTASIAGSRLPALTTRGLA
jgi:dihydropteroate synthase